MFKKIVFAKFSTKIILGALFLGFILGYQPTFNFPPIKKSVVRAQLTQAQTITPQEVPIEFQLPHPGYLSTHFSSYHPGVDIATGFGMPINPIAEGKVINAGFNFWGLGLVVEVEHEHGYKSLYAHLGKTYVKKDQKVTKGDFLGEVGLTGFTSGPHTHLELYKDSQAINPLLILPTIREFPP